MKHLLIALSLLLFSGSICMAETCEEKIDSIKKEIEIAKQQDNNQKLRGLQTALRNTMSNCNDPDLQQKNADKLKDKQNDVLKAQEDLQEAILEGKSASKIQKKSDKVKDKLKELEELTNK